MLAKEVMSNDPIIFSPDMTLKQAAEKMLEYDFGFIPVGENDRLTGTITDRDIVIRGVAKGLDPNNTAIEEVMTRAILYCYEEDDIEKVGKMMGDLRVRRLVVLNADKRITGIITLGDISSKCNDTNLAGQITTAVSQHEI